MNFKKILFRLALVLIFGWGIFNTLWGSPYIYTNNARLKKAMCTVTEERVFLEDVVPFSWTAAFCFDPYTPVSQMEEAIGLGSPALKESASEGMCQLVFVYGRNVVACVSAYPESLGYNVWIEGDNARYSLADGGYARIDHGDYVEFAVSPMEDYLLFHGSADE